MKFWNNKLSGLVGGCSQLAFALFNIILDKLTTYFHSKNIGQCGDNVTIQNGFTVRYPSNIAIFNNVSIGRNVSFSTELLTAKLSIDEKTQINKKVDIDYTGNLLIGKNCVISEGVIIETHDHGYDPKSAPAPRELKIEDNVWIGARAVILPKVSRVGKHSIIAAASVVTKPVEDYVIVAGNPAKIIKRLSKYQ